MLPMVTTMNITILAKPFQTIADTIVHGCTCCSDLNYPESTQPSFNAANVMRQINPPRRRDTDPDYELPAYDSSEFKPSASDEERLIDHDLRAVRELLQSNHEELMLANGGGDGSFTGDGVMLPPPAYKLPSRAPTYRSMRNSSIRSIAGRYSRLGRAEEQGTAQETVVEVAEEGFEAQDLR
ncbi:hypothetical protein G7K_6174-t1 [Saitoella complicata NRRL Y-17804]|uniref:Uncharacterized protein n=1 Tax=Saitoella complicata (strain BCRC 22490 / CBS 7301 / JCM 7358 / NBRC 10748 / NRRL Y-17804) TaxID=698492 RepID=A0A0E9NQL6_SAICN|nr:hypothetical protein G7K_6174-t1 [Saitoella complicata NRRL Y-17804]